MASELENFLSDVSKPESLLDKPLEVTAPEPEKVEDSEAEKEAKFKNRAYRRLEKKYQEEREAGIAMAERIKVLSEVDKFKADVGEDHLKKVEAIFGTNTPEKLAATNILKEALMGMSEKAKTDVLKEWESRQGNEAQEQKEADNEVDEILERVEDEYGLDMSDEDVRRGFITLMEKMSPKYDDGNIKEYADADAVAETLLEFQKKGTSDNSRAKELASRGISRSGESQPSKLEQSTVERFMKEQGLEWS